ncbi:hypothetical protein C3F09_12300 [candidate division GN15 bacterium]|uniref:non-specific serine/threonine protein kinase n=1 Tax=candidate division GN15 bacterium TaxID=2072418 RepID=A0A855X1Y4_9BACT|nr:MAG: hypothetical protein C3F09_12300 [candidate division GN15 bacterium]
MDAPEYGEQETRGIVILAPGAVISHYRIASRLGAGGMGEVFVADDLQLKRRVALKFLAPNLANDLNLKQRFIREAQSAAALNHPNIVTVYEVAEFADRVFIAMEYIEGRTLRELIDAGQLTPQQSLTMALQICEGLQAAHVAGYVHRDVKPLNVIVGHDGRIRILDFGLAKVVGDTQMTQAGSAIGTVQYMSPEQGQGIEADHRSDIFSLGVMLYEMLTSALPFQKIGIPATIYAIINEQPAPLATYRPDLTPGLQEIVSRALAKSPGERYQTVGELADEIRRLLGTQTMPATVIPTRVMPATAPQSVSLAVLHLRNLGTADDDFLSYGITEDLIVDLSRLGTIRVAPMRSVMKYKDSDDDLAEIAARLNVSYVLDGSIHKSVSAVRVSAQLIDVRDGKVLWAERWEEPPASLPRVKKALAEGVSSAFNIGATVVRRAEVALPETENAQAYEQYLRGKFLFDHKKDKGDVEKALEWYGKALKQEPGLLSARIGTVEIHVYQGAIDEAWSELSLALQAAREQGQRAEQASLLRLQSKLLVTKSNWEKAWESGQQALALTRELGDLSGEAETLGILISILQPQAKFDEALELFDRVLEISRKLNDRDKIAEALKNMGVVYARKGDYGRALDLYEEAITFARSAQNLSMEAACLSNIGNVHYFKGEMQSAMRYYGEALSINSKLGDRTGSARQSLNLGLIHLQQGTMEEGLEMLTTAATFFEALGDKANLALTLSNISQARLTLGMADEAQAAAERSLALAQEVRHPLGESAAYHRLGAISEFRGDGEEASRFIHRALETARAAGMNRNVAALEVELAAIHFGQRQFDAARKHAGRASTLAKEIEDKPTLCAAASYLGALTAVGGLVHAGSNQIRQQLNKAQELGDKNLSVRIQQLLGETLYTLGKEGEREEGLALLQDALAQAEASRQVPEVKRIRTILNSSPHS